MCVCGDIHLPYIPKWYWPIKGFSEKPRLDRYFDGKTTFTSFQSLGKGLLSLNRLIQSSIENGGKYAFALSGPFLNQCYWAPKVRNSFLKLQESGQVE
ncbi:MAG: alpha-amylase, partial [Methanosarcinaceae archaeon]|nr:alpha-amylase [Methanosarcinaceae archaeon]